MITTADAFLVIILEMVGGHYFSSRQAIARFRYSIMLFQLKIFHFYQALHTANLKFRLFGCHLPMSLKLMPAYLTILACREGGLPIIANIKVARDISVRLWLYLAITNLLFQFIITSVMMQYLLQRIRFPLEYILSNLILSLLEWQ